MGHMFNHVCDETTGDKYDCGGAKIFVAFALYQSRGAVAGMGTFKAQAGSDRPPDDGGDEEYKA